MDMAQGRPPGWRGNLATLVLLGGGPLMALMFAALGPVLPPMAVHYGGGTSGAFAAQMVMTIPAIGVIVGGLLGGLLVERFGPKPVMIIALAGYAATGVSGYFVDNLWVLLPARFMVGVFVALVGTGIGVIVGAWFEGVKRVKLLGYQSAVAGVFAVTCLLTSGFLADIGGWRTPFLLYLLALVVLALAWTMLPRKAGTVRAEEQQDRSLRPLLKLWPIYLLALFLFTNYFMTSIQLSFLLGEQGVDSALVRAGVIAAGVLAGGVFGGLYGRFYALLGERGVQMMLMLMMVAGLTLIGLSSNLWLIALGAVLSGGGGGMIPPHISGILLNRVPARLRARAVGLEFTVLYIADFVNPLVMTPLRAAIGIHGAFLVAAGGLAIACVILPFVKRKPAEPVADTGAVQAPLPT